MADVLVREPQPGDVDRLLADMRPADLAEVTALRGPDLRGAVERALVRSARSWAAEVDGRLMLLAGVAPVNVLLGVGAPWTLGTLEIDRAPGTFIRLGHEYIPIMRGLYPRLENYVDARNARSLRWLKRMGFEIHAPKPLGVEGRPFHLFTMGE